MRFAPSDIARFMSTPISLQRNTEPRIGDESLTVWLREQRIMYHQQPYLAKQLFSLALSVFESIQHNTGTRDGIELALFICDLALEIRKISTVSSVIETAGHWCGAGIAGDLQIQLLCMQAHCAIWNQQFDQAGKVLQRVMELNEHQTDNLKLAFSFSAFGLLAHRQKELPHAVAYLNQAIKLYKLCDYHGPWIQNYTILAIVERELGEQTQRRCALTDGIALGLMQKRWYETCNLITGLIDMALEQGDLATAEHEFIRCEQLANLDSQDKLSKAQMMLEFSRARILAAKGDFSTACAALSPSLEFGSSQFSATELARRYELLADWLAAAGQAEQALNASRQAQKLLIEQIKAAARHDLTVLQQSMALQHAQTERKKSAQHAAELESKNQKLEQALQLQKICRLN